MKKNNIFSRRDFMKSSALASSVIAGTALVSGCGTASEKEEIQLRRFLGQSSVAESGIKGLLFSQVGYEIGFPVRVIVRLPKKDMLSDSAVCKLKSETDNDVLKTPCAYWGEIWGSHWWIAEFDQVQKEDEWFVEVSDKGKIVFADEGLTTEKRTLWDQTVKLSTVDMLERRTHFTKVGAGWQDAGTLWVESCAQSGMIITLEDVLERASDKIDAEFTERLEKQITVGCDYLVMTQKKAKELGYAEGAFTHDLHGHEHDILPNDANKAAVALYRADRLLSDKYADKKAQYLDAANKAYHWLITEARPLGRYGFEVFQRGIPLDTDIPNDEWVTRDLLMMCWASLEKWKADQKESSKQQCLEYARKVSERQIPNAESEAGFYGHFYEFTSLKHSESSWIHGIVPSDRGTEFGTDLGGFYPNYLIPIIEMYRIWPEHEDAEMWKSMLKDFTDGYLIPACNANPFKLVPLGIYGDQGPIWFCGTFHGTNAIYGYTAALALELYEVLGYEELKDIAYSNLQWIAGLNGGITDEAVKKGCVVFSTDIPEGVALPASMICNIGNRWAGTWFQTRGVICNGFSVGEQFKYDTEPLAENDGPYSLTDEDWIPHSAGWVAGLIRLDEVLDKLNKK